MKSLARIIRNKIQQVNENNIKGYLSEAKCRVDGFDFYTNRIRSDINKINQQETSSYQLKSIKDFCYMIKNDCRIVRIKIQEAIRCAKEKMEPPSIEEICAEIQDTMNSFSNVELSETNNTISVVSPRIVLEDIEFGRFRIYLNLDTSFEMDISGIITANALEPNKNPKSPHIVHPHVECSHICFGDFGPIIKQALIYGRIRDVFDLTIKLLQNYNASSPYEKLETWEMTICECCSGAIASDAVYVCECYANVCPNCMLQCNMCSTFVCARCATTCLSCGNQCCSECSSVCDCGNVVCGECSIQCYSCGRTMCESCDERCRCGHSICEACEEKCTQCCESIVCKNCKNNCDECKGIICEGCLISCNTCGHVVCTDCAQRSNCACQQTFNFGEND